MRARDLGLFLLTVATAFACGGGKEAKSADDAKEDVSPMDELEAMSTELETKYDEAKAPVDQVEPLVADIQALPGKLNISPSDFNAACSATVENGQVTVSVELSADVQAQAEIEAVLTKLTTLVADLKATPDRAQELVALAASSTARLPVLATEVTTKAQAKLAAPIGVSAEAKAAAQAELDKLAGVQEGISLKIQDTQTLAQELPQMATEAMAKLTAAFAASAG